MNNISVKINNVLVFVFVFFYCFITAFEESLKYVCMPPSLATEETEYQPIITGLLVFLSNNVSNTVLQM